MVKYLLLGGTFIIAILLGWRNQELQKKEVQKENEIHLLQAELAKEKSKNQQISEKLATEEQTLQQQELAQQNKVNSLRQQLQEEQRKLTERKQALDEVKSRQKNTDSSVTSQMHQNQERLATLNARLKEYQSAEKDVGKDENQILKNRNTQLKIAQEDLNAKINTLKKAITLTQKDLNFWRHRNHDINQNIKIQELQSTLTNQQQDLTNLESEKINLQAVEQQKNRQIKTQMTQEKEDLKDTEDQIKQQITMVQADLKKDQEQQTKTQLTKTNLQNQLRTTQELYDLQLTKVKNLQSELQK